MTLMTYDKLLPCPLCGDRPDVLIRRDASCCIFCNDCDWVAEGDTEAEAVERWQVISSKPIKRVNRRLFPMDFNEYQTKAQRTSPDGHDRILNGVMGLNGEAGECIDIVKKAMFQGHDLDKEKLLDEASDCLWHLAEIVEGLGVTLEEMALHISRSWKSVTRTALKRSAASIGEDESCAKP